MNIPAIAVAALVPLVIGSIWYHPKVMGTAWLKSSRLTDEEARNGNLWVIFGLTLIFSLMISLILSSLVVHQTQITSLFATQPEFSDAGSEMVQLHDTLLEKYGHLHRSFGHGAFHGAILAIFFVLPVVSILSLFERKGGKYIAVHTGYWVVSLAVMGGIICGWV